MLRWNLRESWLPGGAEVEFPRPECPAGLEGKAGDHRAGALASHRARERRNNRAETAAVQARVGTRRELRRCGCETAEVDSARSRRTRRYLQAVEDIRELHANVQTVAFLDPKVAAEVGVLLRYAEAPERANRGLISR